MEPGQFRERRSDLMADMGGRSMAPCHDSLQVIPQLLALLAPKFLGQ